MAEAFSVDPESLSDSLERMDAFQRMSAALLAEIDGVVKNLHVNWDGVGASAHAQAHQKWSHGAAQMDQALRPSKDRAFRREVFDDRPVSGVR